MRNTKGLPAAAIVVPMLLLFVWMLRLLLAPIAIAGLFAVVLDPLHRRLRSPLLVVACALVGLFAPLGFIALMATRSVVRVVAYFNAIPRAQLDAYVAQGYALIESTLQTMHVHLSHQELSEFLATWGQSALAWSGSMATSIVASAPAVLISFFVFLLTLYFLVRDGDRLIVAISQLLPFDKVDTAELFGSLRDTIRSVMLGSLLVGLVQASLVLVFFVLLSIPGAFVLFVVALVASFIPIVGTTPLTIGATLYLFATGATGSAIAMLIGVVIVGLADNIIRPMVHAHSGNMHPLLSLLSIFGGLQTFGTSGVFFGPVVAAFALWGIELYARFRNVLSQHKQLLSSECPPRSDKV